MSNSNANLQFQATNQWHNQTAHALLVVAFNKANSLGLFQNWDQMLDLKMKKVRYSWSDKLKTLWASIVVGCNHTVEINDKLGSHEKAAAALMGLDRFPDQSQVNRLLHAFEPHHISQWRRLHLELLCRHTRAKVRASWLRLANGKRLLAIDLDQRAMTVSSDHYQLAKAGYFGRKRGRRGYQLSVAFIGGQIREVLDEYFDSGDTAFTARIEDLLDSIALFCKKTRIAADDILIRADAQLGTPANISKIRARGFHFLLKGKSSDRARCLSRKLGEEAIFWRVENGANRLPRWMCDMGEVSHRDESQASKGEIVTARTLLLARLEWSRKKRVRRKPEGEEAERQKEVKLDYYLTDLEAEELPVEQVICVYDDRATIERYFYDEQYSLGARQVRTHYYAGAAIFQYLVATTNNVLRWMKQTTFRGTVIEKMGLGRLIRQAMQIPARVKRRAGRWIVELPKQHHLVKQLMRSWPEITEAKT